MQMSGCICLTLLKLSLSRTRVSYTLFSIPTTAIKTTGKISGERCCKSSVYLDDICYKKIEDPFSKHSYHV